MDNNKRDKSGEMFNLNHVHSLFFCASHSSQDLHIECTQNYGSTIHPMDVGWSSTSQPSLPVGWMWMVSTEEMFSSWHQLLAPSTGNSSCSKSRDHNFTSGHPRELWPCTYYYDTRGQEIESRDAKGNPNYCIANVSNSELLYR